jgi:cytochrome c
MKSIAPVFAALVLSLALGGCEDPPAPEPATPPPATGPVEEPRPAPPAPKPPELTDIEKGAKLAAVCIACHSFKPGEHKLGPSLFNVLGRDIASEQGFNYSKGLQALDGNWDEQSLAKFLVDPGAYAKGTRMPRAGIKNEQDAKYLIAYLKSF